MDAQTVLDDAIAAGYDRLSPRDIMLCVLYGASNGGTGVEGAPDSINYAGPPILNPPNLASVVIDVNKIVWGYVNGWSQIV